MKNCVPRGKVLDFHGICTYKSSIHKNTVFSALLWLQLWQGISCRNHIKLGGSLKISVILCKGGTISEERIAYVKLQQRRKSDLVGLPWELSEDCLRCDAAKFFLPQLIKPEVCDINGF